MAKKSLVPPALLTQTVMCTCNVPLHACNNHAYAPSPLQIDEYLAELAKKEDAQSKKADHEDPAFTVRELVEQYEKVRVWTEAWVKDEALT